MTLPLDGIIAPVTTPFVREEVAVDHLKDNVARYASMPLSALFVLGSNGESAHLSHDEKLLVIETSMQARSPGQLLIAGTGCESIGAAIALSNEAAERGVDCVAVLTPSYYRKQLTDAVLLRYYSEVADSVAVPVLIYNAPGFTGVTVTPHVVSVLSRHPNIAGMKDSSQGNATLYLDNCGADFSYFCGTMNYLLPALVVGAVGGVVSLANAFPVQCRDMYDKFMNGDVVGARTAHFALARLNRAISGSHGVAGVKYAMEIMGYHGGDPRLPLLPLTDDQRLDIRQAIAESGFV